MAYETLAEYLERRPACLSQGPLAVILAEDHVELGRTIQHHKQLGFRHILLLLPPEVHAPEILEASNVTPIRHSQEVDGVLTDALTRVLRAARPGQWVYGCHNAEYLYFPFCETRRVGEMLAFHTEERRHSMFTAVVDLYAPDLTQYPDGVDREGACFDRFGYFALQREEAAKGYAPLERQIDLYGGLRWRFEEHVPWSRRRIDRMSLATAGPDRRMAPDFTLESNDLNTIQCAWHRNLTACVMSFRAAKALRRNPGSRRAISTFAWFGSAPFAWDSSQLLEIGLMEPGQWF